MTRIDAGKMDFTALNALLRETEGDVELHGCLGHRFIGAGMYTAFPATPWARI